MSMFRLWEERYNIFIVASVEAHMSGIWHKVSNIRWLNV